MNFRKSTFDDVDRILEIIEKAKIELRKLGLDQWQNGYPDRKVIENDVKLGISYVLEDIEKNGNELESENFTKILGTIVLSPKKEELYSKIEGKWITNNDYIVIHRLAVDSEVKNKGIATKILKFSEEECIKNKILSIKTDTYENNEPMKKFLEKNGFSYCGVIYLDKEPDIGEKRIAYEKIIKIPHKLL
ncbi:GNAT family N-acetyltransferase [Leptotrichia buccalis]